MPEPKGEKVQKGIRERVQDVHTNTRREEEWKDLALSLGENWSGLVMWFGEQGLGLPNGYMEWMKRGPEVRMYAALAALERSTSLIQVPGVIDPTTLREGL